jgi:hypothetical protein
MRVFSAIVLFLATVGPALSQSVEQSLLPVLDTEKMTGFVEFLRAASSQDGVTTQQAFTSEVECLAQLQSQIATGALLAIAMPFSSVSVLEGSNGPSARFRILLNGERLHVEAHCNNNALTTERLTWGAGDDQPKQVLVAPLDLLLRGLLVQEGRKSKLGLATNQTPTADSVPSNNEKLTAGEMDALRQGVLACWNVGSLSSDALMTSVTVGMTIAQDGIPDVTSIEMISFEGGTEASARQAYEVARRAIIRCGATGFQLPPDKYEQWRNVSITFDAERMRVR